MTPGVNSQGVANACSGRGPSPVCAVGPAPTLAQGSCAG
jgi:hypothetical protein